MKSNIFPPSRYTRYTYIHIFVYKIGKQNSHPKLGTVKNSEKKCIHNLLVFFSLNFFTRRKVKNYCFFLCVLKCQQINKNNVHKQQFGLKGWSTN